MEANIRNNTITFKNLKKMNQIHQELQKLLNQKHQITQLNQNRVKIEIIDIKYCLSDSYEFLEQFYEQLEILIINDCRLNLDQIQIKPLICPSLTVLDLSNNLLVELPLIDCPKLEKLILKNNLIEKFPLHLI